MKEAEFLGGLLPSHPDFEPIIKAVRKKYNLPELYPQDEPIEEIYLGDEIVSLEEFTQDVKRRILENMETMFPEDYVKKYTSAKRAIETDYRKQLEPFNDDLKPAVEIFFEMTKSMAQTVYQILDAQFDELTGIICNHLLLGDSPEAPHDWFGKILTSKSGEETILIAMISELTDLDLMFQQIRKAHKKTYGGRRIKMTNKTADAAYFLQLKRRGAGRDFILDEFIRLNKFDLPKNRNSPRYREIRDKYWQRLKKRLKKAQDILDAISGGK